MTIKDTKHWATKSEAAKDEVKDFVEEAVDWLIIRRREAGMTAAGVALLALIVGLFLYNRHTRLNEAWDKLSQAELFAYSGRVPEAQTLLTEVAEGGGAPAAATLASMLQGDLHYPKGEFDQALAAYDKAAQTATDALRPYALADKVMTLQAAGKSAECAAAAQSFLDATPDHLMAAQVHVALARCQLAQGQNEAAKSTMQRIKLQYPNTPWSEWASARLETSPK
jgi:tetratricopeptide (TPR) repeat protein